MQVAGDVRMAVVIAKQREKDRELVWQVSHGLCRVKAICYGSAGKTKDLIDDGELECGYGKFSNGCTIRWM